MVAEGTAAKWSWPACVIDVARIPYELIGRAVYARVWAGGEHVADYMAPLPPISGNRLAWILEPPAPRTWFGAELSLVSHGCLLTFESRFHVSLLRAGMVPIHREGILRARRRD